MKEHTFVLEGRNPFTSLGHFNIPKARHSAGFFIVSQSLHFLRAFQLLTREGEIVALVWSRNPFTSLGHFNSYRIVLQE